ncbi:hypothetical protein HAX54_047757, partial [Datura stramonium]|nr:hypothetical protein [Datura stramonium]
ETQVEAILFNADITYYEDMFTPFRTYLVSMANIKESNHIYGNPINNFTWIVDRSTIVEPIEMIVPPEHPLSLPTRLTLALFDSFDSHPIGSEFGIH